MDLGGASSTAEPRAALGVLVTVAGLVLATVVMLALRADVHEGTAAAVLIIPLVAGVTVGGLRPAVVGVLGGLLSFDYFFLKPYGTFSPRTESWLDMGVYVVVAVLVARVVHELARSRALARARTGEVHALLAVSRLLIGDEALDPLLAEVSVTLRRTFGLERAEVWLMGDDGGAELRGADGPAPKPASPGGRAVALRAGDREVGRLVVSGRDLDADQGRLLDTFANHVALAIDRARLQSQATRAKVLEQVDDLRGALLRGVSHDLRTPLAAIKAAVSDLLDAGLPLSDVDRQLLLGTIDGETDRLTRLVANVLDLSRIEAGALEPRRQPVDVAELTEEACRRLRALDGHPVDVDVPADLPLVDADYVLVDQIMANLLENASRYGAGGIRVDAAADADRVVIGVSDRGPGVPAAERERVFAAFQRSPGSMGTGVGLAICKAFVAAHGGRIWVEDRPGGGARFAFDLPVASMMAVGDDRG